MNICMQLRYDGTSYFGWQKQPNAQTVQETLETAIYKTTGELSAVTGCSRTDSGVHALNYVCNFQTNTSIAIDNLKNAINFHLPKDIVILAVSQADLSFHARHDATGKTYIYNILNKKERDPFWLGYSWHIPYNLDISAMQAACTHFIGEHDFAGFMSSGSSVLSTIRNVSHCSIKEKCSIPGLFEFSITANGFLYNMVRIIVGTLAAVGSGKIEASSIPSIILSRSRSKAGITAPPGGLFLNEVFYD